MADSGEYNLTRTIFALTETSPGILTHLASFEGSATGFNAPFGSLSYSQPLADGGASTATCFPSATALNAALIATSVFP